MQPGRESLPKAIAACTTVSHFSSKAARNEVLLLSSITTHVAHYSILNRLNHASKLGMGQTLLSEEQQNAEIM